MISTKLVVYQFFFFFVINEWIARTSQIVINDTFIYKLYVNKLKINTPNIIRNSLKFLLGRLNRANPITH